METFHRSNDTGNSRIIRDKVAELNDLIQLWNEQVRIGTINVHTINKTDLSKGDQLNSKLYELCEQLRHNICQMESIVRKMESIVYNLAAITKLQKNDTKLFKTWAVNKFEEFSNEILKAYKEELKIKTMIAESIAHQENEIQGLALEAAWIYEPQISSNVKICLDGMLLETGLRNTKK